MYPQTGQPVYYQQAPPQGQPPQYQYPPGQVVYVVQQPPPQQQQQLMSPSYGYDKPSRPSQPITPQSVSAVPLEAGGKNQDERFAVREGWRDPIWALLWALQTIAVIALAVIFYKKAQNESSTGQSTNVKLEGKAWGLLFVFLAVGGVLSALYLKLVQRYAKQLIWFTLVATVALQVLWAIIAFAAGAAVMGIIFAVTAALTCLWVYLVRSRIPFSALILEIVSSCVSHFFASTVGVALASVVVQGLWVLAWAVFAVSIFQHLDRNKASQGQFTVVYFFLCVSLYWTAQVVKNVVHVTCAGLMSTWYFLAPNNMPENPTMKALKRATTTSLGSICLGSLVVAVLRAFRAVVDQLTRSENELVRCLVLCVLDCINNLVEYFNQYAYTQIAIYGKTYCEAARDTWQLIKARGCDALINDQLISGVLFLGTFMVAVCSAGIGAVLGKAWLGTWPMWAAIGFAAGLLIAMCAMEVVESCVCALFVCYAEDPAALQQTKPDVYARFDAAYNERRQQLGQ